MSVDPREPVAAVDVEAPDLDPLLRPQRIAVVGASRRPDAIGAVVFANLLDGGFTGVVHPVNKAASEISGVAAHPSLSACPAPPDLVVVCVPAGAVPSVVDEALSLGVRAICVISAGFAETGEDGRRVQAGLVDRVRAAGARLVGPNCMGIASGAADVRMNATFSPVLPRPGRVSFASQSGALGLSVLEHLEDLGLGIAEFVSMGNKADLSGNDLLLHWERDPGTDVILLYLESFGNPRRFSRIARRVSRTKPIVAVKAGRSVAGQRAASSHTAALTSGDRATDALFRQTGVIRTDTLEELFGVATLAATQPPPPGRRVAIMTNGGGPGILAADACESHGLTVAALDDDTQARLRRLLPAGAGVSNPVDMIASSTAGHYAATLRILGNAPGIDAVMVIFIPPIVTVATDVARAIADARRDIPPERSVLSVFMGAKGVLEPLADARIPSFPFPEDAAYALGAYARWSDWQRRPAGHTVEPDGLDPDRARPVVDRTLAEAGTARVWLSHDDARQLLDAFGIPSTRTITVTTAQEAEAAFEALDAAQVALKVDASIHKSDVGGVALGLGSAAEVAAEVDAMRARMESVGLGEHARRFLVQEMVTEGVEMMVGVTHDPSFGPLIAIGAGGTLVELIGDVALRIVPLTDVDVEDMLTSLRTYPLLTGYRGSPLLDVDGLKDLLHRLNALVEAVPELDEMDLNPVFVGPSRVVAADARISLRSGRTAAAR